MTVRIRLARGGRKKVPFYKVVVTDSRNARDGGFIERIGTYDPLLAQDNPERFKIDVAKAEKWLSVGAVPSETVAKFLCNAKIKGAEKYKPVFVPKAKKVEEKPATENNADVNTAGADIVNATATEAAETTNEAAEN